MIADILSNPKLNSIVTELFTSGRVLNISLVFITQCYFAVPKKKKKTKFYTLFYYENSEEKRASTNCI